MPSSYWRIFSSRPESRSSSRTAGRLLLAAAVQRGAQLVAAPGRTSRADGVHDVLGVALDDGHRRLHLVDDRHPLGPGDERHQAALADAVDERRAGRRATGASRPRGSTFTSTVSSSARSEAGEVLAQPRHAGELDRVGDLVDRDPGDEVGLVDVEARGRPRAGSGATKSRRSGDAGSSRTSSYWPSTRWAR